MIFRCLQYVLGTGKVHLCSCLSGPWKPVHPYRTTAFLSHTSVTVAQPDPSASRPLGALMCLFLSHSRSTWFAARVTHSVTGHTIL